MGRNSTQRLAQCLCLFGAAALLLCLTVSISAEDAAAAKATTTPEQIQQWVKDLGDEDFQVREAANAKLHEAGEAALESLEKAATESDDFEVRDRASRLGKKIELQLRLAAMEALKKAGVGMYPIDPPNPTQCTLKSEHIKDDILRDDSIITSASCYTPRITLGG